MVSLDRFETFKAVVDAGSLPRPRSAWARAGRW